MVQRAKQQGQLLELMQPTYCSACNTVAHDDEDDDGDDDDDDDCSREWPSRRVAACLAALCAPRQRKIYITVHKNSKCRKHRSRRDDTR